MFDKMLEKVRISVANQIFFTVYHTIDKTTTTTVFASIRWALMSDQSFIKSSRSKIATVDLYFCKF